MERRKSLKEVIIAPQLISQSADGESGNTKQGIHDNSMRYEHIHIGNRVLCATKVVDITY